MQKGRASAQPFRCLGVGFLLGVVVLGVLEVSSVPLGRAKEVKGVIASLALRAGVKTIPSRIVNVKVKVKVRNNGWLSANSTERAAHHAQPLFVVPLRCEAALTPVRPKGSNRCEAANSFGSAEFFLLFLARIL